MPEEILDQQPQVNQEEMDYIDVINDLKANTVSKDRYDRLLADNKKLLQSISKGESIEGTPAPKTPTIKEAVAPLADRDNITVSLEFAKQSLAFREAVIAAGKRDPYLPQGDDVAPTSNDYERASKMEKAFKHCIEVADGDEAVFLNEWNRIYLPSPMGQARGRR